MKFDIERQESYSRGELLLRTFLGMFYIAIPHMFILVFLSLWSMILNFITFWAILFTGTFPRSFFDYQVKFLRWNIRVNASLNNFLDGYPGFGLETIDERITFEVPYPENISRGSVLLRTLFGFFYVLLPHIFILYFRLIGTMFLIMFAWFSVLFTGNYPENWFKFNVGTFRWALRVGLYMRYMTNEYPPFSGKDNAEIGVLDTPLDADL